MNDAKKQGCTHTRPSAVLLFFWAVSIGWMLSDGCRKAPAVVEEITAEPFGAPVQREFSGKAQIKIDLQGGFKEDRVVLLVDGRKKLSKKITTNLTTGLAERLEFEWEKPVLTLGVVLESEKREWRCKLDLKLGTNIGLNKFEGRIRVIQSQGPFGYF